MIVWSYAFFIPKLVLHSAAIDVNVSAQKYDFSYLGATFSWNWDKSLFGKWNKIKKTGILLPNGVHQCTMTICK